MTHGFLVINLDPAFIRFSPSGHRTEAQSPCADSWLHCTVDEIRDLLIELGAITPYQAWPPRECIMRFSVELPPAALSRFQVAPSS